MGTHLHPAARLGLAYANAVDDFRFTPPRPRKTRYLAILARLLETFHENGNRFDLGHWCQFEEDDGGNRCGTSACAVGWAMQHPELNRKGFGMTQSEVPCVFRGPAPTFSSSMDYCQKKVIVAQCRDTNVREGWNSVLWFFGLSYNEALWLFDVTYYGWAQTTGVEGAANVAARIRRLLKGEKAPDVFAVAR